MNDSHSKIKGGTLPSSPPSQNTPNIKKKKKNHQLKDQKLFKIKKKWHDV